MGRTIDLAGRTAVITGATRGIGKAISLSLAGHRMNLALTGRSKGNLDKTAAESEQLGSTALAVSVDFSLDRAPYEVIKRTVDRFGGIDILINNAGTALNLPFEQTGDDDWDTIMKVNARAPFILCREAIPWLEQSDIPTIINISSVVGHKGYIRQAAYSASKHALMGFTKALAREVQNRDIRVHALAPGGVATDLVASMRPDLDTRELIQPEELADIVLFLLLHRGNAVIDEINIRRISNTPWQ